MIMEEATFVRTLKKHIFLHPSNKKKLFWAVKSTLLNNKNKYSDKLEGALLDVNNLKVIGDSHLIVDGYLSMEVIADFHVFSPKPGQVLEGFINKCSKSHIGCLVLDTFNASLTKSGSAHLEPDLGDLCTFLVTEVIVDGEILFMRGTLQSVTPQVKTVSPYKESRKAPEEEDNRNSIQDDSLLSDIDQQLKAETALLASELKTPSPCKKFKSAHEENHDSVKSDKICDMSAIDQKPKAETIQLFVKENNSFTDLKQEVSLKDIKTEPLSPIPKRHKKCAADISIVKKEKDISPKKSRRSKQILDS
ncbi:DNA-directed RNA polymerase I subunit RPA43-like [Physella acuta]|uniref:DNA-directed RNA polymerase I subunit RPA43-like n=1 Tax=Physella acuta TaxID=109671 RepID=UPI0027DC1C92|nr:DNA-directed RNA polymerase I subunit RPA43-like [Physella acuta]